MDIHHNYGYPYQRRLHVTDDSQTTSQSAPAGWYPDANRPGGQRWWDGHQWTAHFWFDESRLQPPTLAPRPNTAAEGNEQAAKPSPGLPRIYWSNLFRIRVWWFTIATSVVVGVALTALGMPPALTTPVFLVTLALVGYFWLTQQMACRSCGSVLRVTRLTGAQEVCQRCGAPTDKALRAAESHSGPTS